MMRTLSNVALFLSAILLFASCREVPVTERKQLILIPESSEMKLGEDALSKIEKGLAEVIGHEVGHAIARHGAERISATLLSQLGQIALNLIVDVDAPIVLD